MKFIGINEFFLNEDYYRIIAQVSGSYKLYEHMNIIQRNMNPISLSITESMGEWY